MSDDTTKELIRNLPAIITAAGVIVTAYLSYRSNKQSQSNSLKIDRVEQSVNGKMSQLLEVSTVAAKAEGVLVGEANSKNGDPIQVEIVQSPVPVTVVDETEEK